jgi:hypothetical protein
MPPSSPSKAYCRFYFLIFFPNYLDSLHICLYLQDSKSISAFIAYALCAADEALRDANWLPNETEKKERTVIYCFNLGCLVRMVFFSF